MGGGLIDSLISFENLKSGFLFYFIRYAYSSYVHWRVVLLDAPHDIDSTRIDSLVVN